MYLTKVSDVESEEVQMEGVEKVSVQWLINKPTAPNFAMRLYTMKKGGVIPLHRHEWEHEILIISGKGLVRSEQGDQVVEKDNVIFVPGNEKHGFGNAGEEEFKFLCMIPVQ